MANLSPGRNSRPPSQQNLDEIETARAAARLDFAAILESLDNTAQANLLQILAQLSGAPARRVMEHPAPPSAANARATPSRSDRMERRNFSNPAHNVDALHQMTELLATLQRNHTNGRPAHPENLRPATRHVEAPEAATDEEEGERGIFEEIDEGNGPCPLPHAPTPHSSSALVPIPPARPHLRSALVKSNGVRTQMFGFERIQIIARHALSALPSEGSEQAALYLKEIEQEAEEKILFLFTADQRGFDMANVALKIKYGEVVEDKTVKSAAQIVAAMKKSRPDRTTSYTQRYNQNNRGRGNGERSWNKWRRDGDGRCFICREPGHGLHCIANSFPSLVTICLGSSHGFFYQSFPQRLCMFFPASSSHAAPPSYLPALASLLLSAPSPSHWSSSLPQFPLITLLSLVVAANYSLPRLPYSAIPSSLSSLPSPARPAPPLPLLLVDTLLPPPARPAHPLPLLLACPFP
ncbi:unnamed protein product [Closterium sp. NIES-54]